MEFEQLESEQLFEESESVSDNNVVFNVVSSPPDVGSYALDTFDRIVENLPSWYGYVAYKVSDDEYFLLSGSEYSISGDTIYFGNDAVLSSVYLDQNGDIQFDGLHTSNTGIQLQTGSVYYTNLVEGYPALGDHEISLSAFMSIGLVCVVLGSILTRSSRR